MRSILATLLFLGITSIRGAGQQPPPPPPQTPPPTAAQSSTQAPAADNTNPQQQVPASDNTNTQQQAPAQNPPAQNPSAQNPNEPVIPTAPPPPGAQNANLPQKEELERELSRIQEQEDMVNIREKSQNRMRESRAVLREALSAKVPIPAALLQKSKCVIVIPALKKAAVGVGAKYGRGVMSCRLGQDYTGPWSAPAMYAVEGGNLGFQIGLQGTDMVLLVMNERGVDSLLGTKFKLGGDAALSAGPFGRNAEASTDLAMRAKILAYSRSHGIFAGVSLDGSTLRPDTRANQALYGREISARRIVRNGDVVVPVDGVPLIQLLDQSVHTASNNPAPGDSQRK